jgi:RNA polymerase sigma factor (TIGR02999 family)
MSDSASQEITGLLRSWRSGDSGALNRLAPVIYEELKRLAHRSMRNQASGNTLQATALVNEAYLRLVDATQVDWRDRAHFFAVSAQIMRWILVDRARSRGAARRGGDEGRAHSTVDFEAIPDPGAGRREEILAVDEALTRLTVLDPRKGKVVELRFFGGLSVEETAEILKISVQSVLRDWKLAKSWLLRELGNKR